MGRLPKVLKPGTVTTYVLNNPISLVDPDGMMHDVPNTMSGEAFGKKPIVSANKTPEQRAVTYGCLGPLALTTLAAGGGALSPAGVANMYLGGSVGLMTSSVQAFWSDAPIDKRVGNVFLGTGLGFLFGPTSRITEPGVGTSITALLSSLVSDKVLNGQFPSPLSSGKETGKGYLSGIWAHFIPGGPTVKAVAGGFFKLGLDAVDYFLSEPPPEKVEIDESDHSRNN